MVFGSHRTQIENQSRNHDGGHQLAEGCAYGFEVGGCELQKISMTYFGPGGSQ